MQGSSSRPLPVHSCRSNLRVNIIRSARGHGSKAAFSPRFGLPLASGQRAGVCPSTHGSIVQRMLAMIDAQPGRKSINLDEKGNAPQRDFLPFRIMSGCIIEPAILAHQQGCHHRCRRDSRWLDEQSLSGWWARAGCFEKPFSRLPEHRFGHGS